jgi:chitinase
MRRPYALLLSITGLALAGCVGSGSQGEDDPHLPPGKLVIGYYPSWVSEGEDPYPVSRIPAHLLTHVNFAFADVSAETGTVVVGFPELDLPSEGGTGGAGNFAALNALKERNPHLKTLISVGGWTWSGNFSQAARTPESRARFAESAAAFAVQHGFDGVDIDWEYPASDGLQEGNPRDSVNFTLLLAELRLALDKAGQDEGRQYLLTIAAPASVSMAKRMQLNEIHKYLDWINVMTYDFAGEWSEKTNFNAALYPTSSPLQPDDPELRKANVHDAMEAYLAGGVPIQKLVVGVPFFGKSWAGVPDENHGLYQPMEGTGRVGTSWERVSTEHVDMEEFWEEEAQVPWLYDPVREIMITFENPRSIRLKGAYVRERGMAGAMFWQMTGDTDSNVLLKALLNGLADQD